MLNEFSCFLKESTELRCSSRAWGVVRPQNVCFLRKHQSKQKYCVTSFMSHNHHHGYAGFCWDGVAAKRGDGSALRSLPEPQPRVKSAENRSSSKVQHAVTVTDVHAQEIIFQIWTLTFSLYSYMLPFFQTFQVAVHQYNRYSPDLNHMFALSPE